MASSIDTSVLTNNSKSKFELLKINSKNRHHLNQNLIILLKNMLTAFIINLDLRNVTPINIYGLRNIFIDFNRTFNLITGSKFENDVKQMNMTFTFELKIANDVVTINFLVEDINKSRELIAVILHSLHTFCYLFPYNYNNLTIYICLDDNKRNIEIFESQNNFQNIFENLRKKSAAFNISGVTEKFNKKIILTKSEEIIKLMYHEMIHYIGLDSELIGFKYQCKWSIANINLNLFEAYTEFMSIILNSAYETIHLASLKKINMYDLYENILYTETQYSIYLCANILKFYGYTANTFNDFFNGIGEIKYSPIPTWEYVMIRTQLLLHLDDILNILNNEWKININNINNIVNLIVKDNILLNKLTIFMLTVGQIKNISYTMIEFNWNFF